MNRIYLIAVLALILFALVFAHGQAPQKRKSIQVTNEMITSQRGRPYVIDLRNRGTTYTVTADVASRVRIRTKKGEMTATDLLRKLNLTGSKFVVGTLMDFVPANFRPPGSRTFPRTGSTATAFKCDGNVCKCNPIAPNDCWQMGFDCETSMICVNPCDGPECTPEQSNQLLFCWCEALKE